MYKPIPLVEIQKVVHYAMPLIGDDKRNPGVGRQSLCGISTLIPGRRVSHKDYAMGCRVCRAVETQVRLHSPLRKKDRATD